MILHHAYRVTLTHVARFVVSGYSPASLDALGETAVRFDSPEILCAASIGYGAFPAKESP